MSSTAQVRDYHNDEDDEYESHYTAGDNYGQTRGGFYPRCVVGGYKRFHGLNLVLVKLLSCKTENIFSRIRLKIHILSSADFVASLSGMNWIKLKREKVYFQSNGKWQII